MPEAKAAYRFIPLNKEVVEPPLSLGDINHSAPLPNGYCGEIEVTWRAETPICVGSALTETVGNVEVATPFKLGNRYALPGAGIKGMLRSIVEIASYSHLGQINAKHHFGYRDYNDSLYRNRVDTNNLKAGWLTYESGKWRLAPAGGEGKFLLAPIYLILGKGLPPDRLKGLAENETKTLLNALKFNNNNKKSNSFYNTMKNDVRNGFEEIKKHQNKEENKTKEEIFNNIYFDSKTFTIELRNRITNHLFNKNTIKPLSNDSIAQVIENLTIDLELLDNDNQFFDILNCAINNINIPQDDIDSILGAVTLNWKALDIGEKYQLLRYWGFQNLKCSYDYETINGYNNKHQLFTKLIITDLFKDQNKSGANGHLACSGKTMPFGNKKYEAVVQGPGCEIELSPNQIKQFAFINSKLTRNKLEPEGNWAYWLREKGYPNPLVSDESPPDPVKSADGLPGIPVFYSGDPLANPADTSSFFMGLSRVVKIPYKYSVGEIAARTTGQEDDRYSAPNLDQRIDFARAIFGDVEGSWESRDEDSKEKPNALALKGRVAFGFAYSENAKPMENHISGVFMGPRASFWPFYLRSESNPDQTVSYNEDNALLAGRKRYPLRQDVIESRPGSPGVTSHARFLEAGAEFKGVIRFHNLHEIELGALLWALTFGQPDASRPYRHTIGRAKGLGCGRLYCTYTLMVQKNHEANLKKESSDFINKFEEYMEDKVKCLSPDESWKDSKSIQALLNMADPTKGGRQNTALESISDPKDFMKLKKARLPLPDKYWTIE